MARFVISPLRSELWAEARSSLHPVRIHTTGLEGVIEAEPSEGTAPPRLGLPTQVELETQRLRSGNGLVDGELQRRLDARTFPRVRAELRSIAHDGARTRLTGDLTLHGVTRTLEVEVTVRQLDARTLEIVGGRAIDMRDFGLPPPSFLMFKVQPEVQVRARLIAEREH